MSGSRVALRLARMTREKFPECHPGRATRDPGSGRHRLPFFQVPISPALGSPVPDLRCAASGMTNGGVIMGGMTNGGMVHEVMVHGDRQLSGEIQTETGRRACRFLCGWWWSLALGDVRETDEGQEFRPVAEAISTLVFTGEFFNRLEIPISQVIGAFQLLPEGGN